MLPTVYVALIGWLPISLAMFFTLRPAAAALGCVVLGHLLLPQAAIDLPGTLELSKPNVIGLSLLIAFLVVRAPTKTSPQRCWLDLPMVVWCCAPLATSLTNGLGARDGLADVIRNTLAYGAPYLAGRRWFASAEGVQLVVKGIVYGGLLYVPLCLLESRLSPQLHVWIYGFHQHSFSQTVRFGGYRPVVFMQHGLAVGLWMAAATLAAFATTARTRRGRGSLGSNAAIWLVLAATTLLCRSLGSWLLLAAGLLALWLTRRRRATMPLLLLALAAPTEIATRFVVPGGMTAIGPSILGIEGDRSQSLSYRLYVDDQLRRIGMQQPIFGWGGWGRNRRGLEDLGTDSFWALVLSKYGLVGLCSIFGVLTASQWAAIRRLNLFSSGAAERKAATGLIACVAVYQLDSIVNAMHNPVFYLAAGALVSFAEHYGRSSIRPRSSTPGL